MSTAIKTNNSLIVRYGKGKKQFAPVASIAEASHVVTSYLDAHGFGFSEWCNDETGKVFDAEGNQVARISYNGRIWSNEGKEISRAEAEKQYYSLAII